MLKPEVKKIGVTEIEEEEHNNIDKDEDIEPDTDVCEEEIPSVSGSSSIIDLIE